MKVPFSWLKEFVDIDVTAQELEEKLFSCGFEVEELIPLDAGISKVVVGKIVEMEKQEGTHLTKCVVDCAAYGHDIRISTGAANMKLGDCVPAALDVSTLPGGIKIKARKMQGVESNGMLCSGEELGLNDDLFPGAEVYGLLILPEDSVPGTDIAPVVGLDDYIFDISITANRPDCQSVLGIAREVAAVLGKPLHMPAMDYKAVCEPDAPITVKVEAPELCPRYMAHYVRNIRMGESPRWMKRHLALCGLRSISNVVDITNHTLLEMGQPMHAFDLNKVAGRSITVRRAVEGEKITTLDEKEFTLNPNNLVICDAEKPVALAGIMGGANSGMDDNTTSLLFECATFARDSVRKTSRALGQNSDSSARYEKGVDRHSPELGLARALHLIQELDCGDITTLEYDLTDGRPLERKHIVTTPAKICGVLGITVPDQTMIDILQRLEFTVDVQADGSWDVSAPLYREDVESFPDLAEEVIREYGYDHIVPTFLNTAAVTNGGLNYEQKQQLKTKRLLAAQGFYEASTLAFYSNAELDMLHIPAEDAARKAHGGREMLAVGRERKGRPLHAQLREGVVDLVARHRGRAAREHGGREHRDGGVGARLQVAVEEPHLHDDGLAERLLRQQRHLHAARLDELRAGVDVVLIDVEGFGRAAFLTELEALEVLVDGGRGRDVGPSGCSCRRRGCRARSSGRRPCRPRRSSPARSHRGRRKTRASRRARCSRKGPRRMLRDR